MYSEDLHINLIPGFDGAAEVVWEGPDKEFHTTQFAHRGGLEEAKRFIEWLNVWRYINAIPEN